MQGIGVKTASLESAGWQQFKITATTSSADCIAEWLIAAKNINEAVVEFVCYEIQSTSDFGLFLKKDWNNSSELVDDPIDAEVFFEGVIKWDGDCQWDVPNGLCFYGHAGAQKIGKLIEEIVILGESMLSPTGYF